MHQYDLPQSAVTVAGFPQAKQHAPSLSFG